MNELSWILLILVIVTFYFVTSRAAVRIGSRTDIRHQRNERHRLLQDSVWKVNKTIEMFRANLDNTKLVAGQDEYTYYYIGYLIEIARAISKRNQIEFSSAFQLPILVEAHRLCGHGDKDLHSTEQLMVRILGSEAGQKGVADGEVDGDYAVNSYSGGPYFEKIIAYFQSCTKPDTKPDTKSHIKPQHTRDS